MGLTLNDGALADIKPSHSPDATFWATHRRPLTTRRGCTTDMSTFVRYLSAGIVTLALGIMIFLVTWNIQPETEQVEIVIPDDTLPK
jgi:hypothetical protein